MRENHYALLAHFENFSGFQLQDKHNASSNSNIKMMIVYHHRQK
jgi:hypothetical protein